MVFRSGQSGYVVRKGQMWHGRYYIDVPVNRSGVEFPSLSALWIQ
jgi:hypothetical protein